MDPLGSSMTKNPDPGLSPRFVASFSGRRLLLTCSTGFVRKVVLSTILQKITGVGNGKCASLNVSTCFVAGDRDGQIDEDLRSNEAPITARTGFNTFNVLKEVEEARKIIARLTQDEVEDASIQAELWKEAEGNPR